MQTDAVIKLEQIGVKDVGDRGEQEPRGVGMGDGRKNGGYAGTFTYDLDILIYEMGIRPFEPKMSGIDIIAIRI